MGEHFFKDGGAFIERYVDNARHIEVQIFGDGSGRVLALGERDCSVQRRNQKVIEETPAPRLPQATRAALHAAALRLGESVCYRSAGTVEFIVEQPGGYDQGQYGAPAGYAPSAITLYLEDGSNRTFQLHEGSNVIGRGQDAQFRLPDTGVSRRHVEIRWEGRTAMLTDLNSTNGTTVNDVQVNSWELADGDRIRVGHSDIVVRFQ